MMSYRIRGLLGIALLLALPGCQKSQAVGKAGKVPPSPDGTRVLARVGDYLITQKQVDKRIEDSVKNKDALESNKANPDVFQIALDALVDQVTWARAGDDAGIGKDPQIARDAYLYRSQLVATKYLADRVEKETMPTEAEIQEFYDKWKDHYQKPVRIAARHIQLSTREKAEDVLKQILNGASFNDMARKYSEDTITKDLGGALGYISVEEGAMGIGKDMDFLSEALKLKKGETSGVIKSSKGWHIVYCEEREGGTILPLEEVRDDVIQRVRKSDKIAAVYNQRLAEARHKYGAEIFQSEVDAATGVTEGSVTRLWEVVDMQPNERGMIEVLRRITFDFPHDPLADDAQLRMAYIYAVKLKEPKKAEKALMNMKARYPNSDLKPAADWLQAHVNDAEIDLKTFDDLKAKATKS